MTGGYLFGKIPNISGGLEYITRLHETDLEAKKIITNIVNHYSIPH